MGNCDEPMPGFSEGRAPRWKPALARESCDAGLPIGSVDSRKPYRRGRVAALTPRGLWLRIESYSSVEGTPVRIRRGKLLSAILLVAMGAPVYGEEAWKEVATIPSPPVSFDGVVQWNNKLWGYSGFGYGTWVSEDAGVAWRPITPTFIRLNFSGMTGTALTLNGQSGPGASMRIVRSQDGGATWTVLPAGSCATTSDAIAVAPYRERIYVLCQGRVGAVPAGSSPALGYSDDGGQSWRHDFATVPSGGQPEFSSNSRGLILTISDNAADAYEIIGTSVTPVRLRAFAKGVTQAACEDRSYISYTTYVGKAPTGVVVQSHLLKTSNAGRSWSEVGLPLDVNLTSSSFACSGSKLLIVSSEPNISMYSEDEGNSWIPLSNSGLSLVGPINESYSLIVGGRWVLVTGRKVFQHDVP